ncbi:MAG: DNA polymerase IV [Bacillota bacterium]|nr:DNA polymerase IV [Bacillota bacterium]
MTSDILLCDLDAFFAAVEQHDHPEYRGRPVIVGGDPGARGVVSTCSYEARKYGVRSAMPVRRALELCPKAVLLPVDMRRYRELSAQVMEVFHRFTPDIEAVSIDEAYLAVKAGRGVETAAQIRDAVRMELGLPVSVGVSGNKLLAKIACEMAKPDGLKALWPADVPAVLWPLPVKVLPGVGPRSEEKLTAAGIRTVGDLACAPALLLKVLLGGFGATLRNYAHGLDDRRLVPVHQVKSVSEETTFPHDVAEREYVWSVLMELAEGVGYRLRKKGLTARTITLKLRYADFRTITRARTLACATDRDTVIYKAARELFDRHGGTPPWRLIGVRASNLTPGEQLSLVPSGGGEKEREVSRALDGLRARYGREMVWRARRLVVKEKDERT